MRLILFESSFLKVVCSGLIPCSIVAVGLFVFRNILIAMFMMHWIGMIPVAVGVCVYNRGAAGLVFYLDYLLQQKVVKDAVQLIFLFFLGLSVTIGMYVADSCKTNAWALCVGRVDERISQYGFHDYPHWLVVLCAIYFPVVNPFIEEMFWRVFMIAETSVSGTDTAQPDEEAQLMCEKTRDDAKVHLKTEERFPLQKAIVFGTLYASYHTLVVGILLGGWLYAAVSFLLVSGLGIVFHWMMFSWDPARGFYRAVFLHAGIDLGIVIALADSVGWIHLL